MTLLFYQYEDVFLRSIQQHDVTALCTSTGSGKSTVAPVTACKQGLSNSPIDSDQLLKRVFVTVPTIMASKLLMQRQQQMHPELSIGYAAGQQRNYTKHSNIVYTTTGYLTKRIIYDIQRKLENNNINANSKTPFITFCDYLMIDEVHILSIDNYVLLSLYRWIKNISPCPELEPKLILSSATMAIDNVLGMYPNANLLQFEQCLHPVVTVFHKRDFSFPAEAEPLKLATINKIVSLHKSKPTGPNQDILVFCEGSAQVESIVQKLNELQTSGEIKNCFVLPCYSTLEPEYMDLVTMNAGDLSQLYPEDGDSSARKIIIATNVAESSVTLNGIRFVVDMLLSKILKHDSLNDLSTLECCEISKASAIQRKGRTGRTNAGEYHPMCTKYHFNMLKPHHSSEFDRINIFGVVLEFIQANLPVREILNINDVKYCATMLELLNLNMIQFHNEQHATIVEKLLQTIENYKQPIVDDVHNNNNNNIKNTNNKTDEEQEELKQLIESTYSKVANYFAPCNVQLTNIGCIVPQLNCSIREASFIYNVYSQYYDYYSQQASIPITMFACVLIGLLQGYNTSYFYIPRQTNKQSLAEYRKFVSTHKELYYERFKGFCDLHSLLNMYFAMIRESPVKENGKCDYVRWCKDNSMNNKSWQQARSRIKQLIKNCENCNLLPFDCHRTLTYYCSMTSNEYIEWFVETIKPLYRHVFANNKVTKKKASSKQYVDSAGSVFSINHRLSWFSHLDNQYGMNLFDQQELHAFVRQRYISHTGKTVFILNFVC